MKNEIVNVRGIITLKKAKQWGSLKYDIIAVE